MQLRDVVAVSSSCDVKDDAGRRVGRERKKNIEYGEGVRRRRSKVHNHAC